MVPHPSTDDPVAERRSDVPQITDGWQAISRFALGFHGFVKPDSFEAVAKLGNRISHAFTATGSVSKDLSLDDLRACLFFEQRRSFYDTDIPEGRGAAYVGALLDAVRAKMPA